MKVKYDKEVDVLVIQLSEAKVAESDEIRKGVILDFDQDGNVVRIEILDAAKNSRSPMKFEYELLPKD